MNSMEEVAQKVSQCTDCSLSKGRDHAVPGEGPKDAEIMFIGEGPGFHEDRQGRPFVGPAGKFLEELLKSVGLMREKVFIANVVKCRPPNNRDPTPEEISFCRKYLDRQIELLDPKVIVTLGRYSMARFIPNQTIGKIRGRARTVDGRLVYPMYHPAAAFHNNNLRKVIVEDFKAIPNLVHQSPTKIQVEEPQGPAA
jgi:uracil-DNA glycosylase family 4